MQQKLTKLLDDIQDVDGSITLSRAELELLIGKYGHDITKIEVESKRAFLIGLFWGSVSTFFGLIFLYEIIEVYF